MKTENVINLKQLKIYKFEKINQILVVKLIVVDSLVPVLSVPAV